MRPSRAHDVVVIGAGPAGLSAAVAAAEAGRSVLVIDQAPQVGGQLWRHRGGEEVAPALAALTRRLTLFGVAVARQATVVDAPAPGTLVVRFDGRMDQIRAGAIVLATGAVERLLPFPGWTLPGVLGIGGLQALLKAGMPVRGQRVVLAGTGPLLLPVAATVAKGGGELALVAEQAAGAAVRRFAARALRDPRRLLQAARLRAPWWRVPYRPDSWVVEARGGDRLREVTMQVGDETRTLPCDWLGAAAGLVPRTELGELLGCALVGDAIAVDDRQATSVPGIWAAGECCGVKGEAGGMAEGTIAGHAAAADATPLPSAVRRRRDAGRRLGDALASAFAPRPELHARAAPDTILCRCEDVPVGAIDPAWTQRQAKLWTRVGMGACQGQVCGPACAALYGWARNATRPPLGSPPLGDWGTVLSRPAEPPGA